MKLFMTNNIETVKVPQSFFGISLPSVLLRGRTDKFKQKFSLCAKLARRMSELLLFCHVLYVYLIFYLCATIIFGK